MYKQVLCSKAPCDRPVYLDGFCKRHSDLNFLGYPDIPDWPVIPRGVVAAAAQWYWYDLATPTYQPPSRVPVSLTQDTCRTCLTETQVRSDSHTCEMCFDITDRIAAERAPRLREPFDQKSLTEYVARSEEGNARDPKFIKAFVRACIPIAADGSEDDDSHFLCHPLINQPLFITSRPRDYVNPPTIRWCRACARDGFTNKAVLNESKPWEDAWRLCKAHVKKERNSRRRLHWRLACVACGSQTAKDEGNPKRSSALSSGKREAIHPVRQGGQMCERCHAAWQDARKLGTGWRTFANKSRAKVRAEVEAMSLRIYDETAGQPVRGLENYTPVVYNGIEEGRMGTLEIASAPTGRGLDAQVDPDTEAQTMTENVEITFKGSPDSVASAIRNLAIPAQTDDAELAEIIPIAKAMRRSA